jgi:hypothetical protein
MPDFKLTPEPKKQIQHGTGTKIDMYPQENKLGDPEINPHSSCLPIIHQNAKNIHPRKETL